MVIHSTSPLKGLNRTLYINNLSERLTDVLLTIFTTHEENKFIEPRKLWKGCLGKRNTGST